MTPTLSLSVNNIIGNIVTYTGLTGLSFPTKITTQFVKCKTFVIILVGNEHRTPGNHTHDVLHIVIHKTNLSDTSFDMILNSKVFLIRAKEGEGYKVVDDASDYVARTVAEFIFKFTKCKTAHCASGSGHFGGFYC